MKPRFIAIIVFTFFLTIIFYASTDTAAQEPSNCPPDKELCAKMLRFGKEAYLRGKYLDAKEYFRKAVQADSTSLTAWRYYDQAVIFGLAEKVEKDANLVLPDVSTRQGAGLGLPPTALPALPESESGKKEEWEFKIIDDEGC